MTVKDLMVLDRLLWVITMPVRSHKQGASVVGGITAKDKLVMAQRLLERKQHPLSVYPKKKLRN